MNEIYTSSEISEIKFMFLNDKNNSKQNQGKQNFNLD